ncbi:MAG: LOG family protein [Candidatus Omnitrophota bacterium]
MPSGDKKKKKKKPGWIVKAYNNYEFLNSPQARTIRVLTELIEPAARFRRYKVKDTVVFFGSARALPREIAAKKLKAVEDKIRSAGTVSPELTLDYDHAARDFKMSRYYEDAVTLSQKLTNWFNKIKATKKHFMICSGGGPGIMEAANKGAHLSGGVSVGLNISLPLEQWPNEYQTKELACEFHYFFIRKFWFFYLAKALVIFPGGYGTFDEFFELLTLMQTKKTKKIMPVVLYGSEYWNSLINFETMVKWGMINREDLDLFKMVDDVDSAYKYLKETLTKLYL